MWMNGQRDGDGWTDMHEDMAKLIVAVCNFVNVPKNIPCTCDCHTKLYIEIPVQSVMLHCDILVMKMKHT